MGARNSTTQTVRIENPQRGLAIQVTPSVVFRLEGSQRHKQMESVHTEENQQKQLDLQNKCKEEMSLPKPHSWSNANDARMQKQYNEWEEHQFEATIDKIKTTIGKPLNWVEDVGEELRMLKKDLLKCYQDYPGQTLCCSDVAKKYQDFIFQEQYKSILKFNALFDNPVQQTPNYHSPPYK